MAATYRPGRPAVRWASSASPSPWSKSSRVLTGVEVYLLDGDDRRPVELANSINDWVGPTRQGPAAGRDPRRPAACRAQGTGGCERGDQRRVETGMAKRSAASTRRASLSMLKHTGVRRGRTTSATASASAARTSRKLPGLDLYLIMVDDDRGLQADHRACARRRSRSTGSPSATRARAMPRKARRRGRRSTTGNLHGGAFDGVLRPTPSPNWPTCGSNCDGYHMATSPSTAATRLRPAGLDPPEAVPAVRASHDGFTGTAGRTGTRPCASVAEGNENREYRVGLTPESVREPANTAPRCGRNGRRAGNRRTTRRPCGRARRSTVHPVSSTSVR